ncbi:MAG TPA: hypothetical protein VIZ66_05630 [Sphingomicrobium sp.]
MTNQTSGSTMTQSNKPPAGTPAIVDVTIEPTATGVTCSHEWRWQNGPSEGKGTIDVPQRAQHESGTPIHFHLRDKTDRGFSFTDDIHGPIWVQRDSCPLAKSGDSEIPNDKIESAPKLLKVFNENSEECHMHYRLRFKDKDGQSEDYDPDIKNGGKI